MNLGLYVQNLDEIAQNSKYKTSFLSKNIIWNIHK